MGKLRFALVLLQKKFYRTTVFIIIVGFVVYFPILTNQLLDFWDDQWVVMNYYTESGINIQNIWSIFTEFYNGQYAPFNEYLYLILYQIDGYNPFVFHLASLLLHLANSCFVFIVLKKLLFLSKRIEPDKINIVAFITAVFFCIHPFNVESVAWMSASKVLVYAFFYLLATYTFLLYLEKDKIRLYIFTIILYIFCFLGKEQAVVFPLWMLIIYWILNYELTDKKIWLKILPFFVLSFVFGVITIYSQYASGGGILSNNNDYPLWQRIVFACYSFLEYLFKIIFPFKLSYLYPFPAAIGDPLPNWLLIYPAIIIIIIVTLRQYLKKWPITFGLLSFTIHIAVALHIIPLSRFAIIADRYAYLSVIGIKFILAYYGLMFYDRARSKNLNVLVIILFVSYFLYLGVYAHRRTYTWYNVDTLKKELRELLKQRNDYKILKNNIDNEKGF